MEADSAFVSSRLPVALRDRLKAFATARGQSVQQVVERAVTRLLEQEAREPVARGEARPDSDIDLALEIDPDRKPTLFTLAHLQLVEMRLGAKVDIGLRRDLRPHVAQAFERDAVRVF